MVLENKRQFVSLSGRCAFDCNHCYTLSPAYKQRLDSHTIPEIVNSLADKSFDIVYVSGHRENFINPDEGLDLCESIFKAYNTDLLLTTRNTFTGIQLVRLYELNQAMKAKGKDLYFCVSIPCTSSYRLLEPCELIPTPEERIEFLKSVYSLDIYTLLTIRPLCPDTFIRVGETLEIVDACHTFSSAVISSGIVVDEYIKKRLGNFPEYKSVKGELMKCLENMQMTVEYVNVEKEWTQIRERCDKYGIRLFDHSCPAIEYLKAVNQP